MFIAYQVLNVTMHHESRQSNHVNINVYGGLIQEI